MKREVELAFCLWECEALSTEELMAVVASHMWGEMLRDAVEHIAYIEATPPEAAYG